MAFNDPRYLLFLGLVVLALPAIPWIRARLLAIALISVGFYCALSPRHWYILIGVSIAAYLGGLALDRLSEGRARVAALIICIIITLLPLLFFKYASTAQSLLTLANVPTSRWSTINNLILPIGISFYTFLAVGYLIDVYIGRIPAQRDVIRYAAFISFFPQLSAGPIERAPHLIPQLNNVGVFDYGRAVSGLRAILVGLFLKLVVADTLAPHVDAVYQNPRQHGAIDLGLATIYFSFQVYADFAGYSLIAIGSARLLGIELLTNFMQPWLSQNLPDYWRRWHISLSSWFRDYVFIPLQFQARHWGKLGLAVALIFTFILVGVWHGAGAKYALFGLIHGVLVTFSTLTFTQRDKFWRRVGIPSTLLWAFRAVTTFSVVSLTFVLFRASGITEAIWIYGTILKGPVGVATVPLIGPMLLIAIVIVGDLMVAKGYDLARLSTRFRWASYYLMSITVVAAAIRLSVQDSPHVHQFIYFKF